MIDEAVEEVIRDWNKFVQSLVDARDVWDGLQRHLDENPIHGDRFPHKMGKLLAMHRRMQFTNAIGDISDHWRAYGGLDSFFEAVPSEEELRRKYRIILNSVRRNGNGRR